MHDSEKVEEYIPEISEHNPRGTIQKIHVIT